MVPLVLSPPPSSNSVCYVTHSQCLLGSLVFQDPMLCLFCPVATVPTRFFSHVHRHSFNTTDQTTDKNKDHKRYITNQFTGHLYYIDFFLQKNNFSINLMVAIAVCTSWVFRHVCFVFNGHANGTSDHHRVDHRGKRTFFNQCLVTVHPTRNISRGWHHADSAVGLLKKNKQRARSKKGERGNQKC